MGSLRMPAIFGTNMVLPNSAECPIWGWAAPAAKVRVIIGDREFNCSADESGAWSVSADTQGLASTSLRVSAADEEIAFKNVLVGDVWLCSGQSNMEWTVAQSADAQEAIASADFPQIRLFKVARLANPFHEGDVFGEWHICSPSSIPEFSAVGYYFGRSIHSSESIAVGLIDSAWGGTPIQAWLTRDTPELLPHVERYDAVLSAGSGDPEMLYGASGQNAPGALFATMIRPLQPFAVRGALWYQGESNAGRATEYKALLRALVQSWRRGFRSEFAFLSVQLANYNTDMSWQPMDWPELREAQTAVLDEPNTGLVTAIDVGTTDDIHPLDKQLVGERLANAARRLIYKKGPDDVSPMLRSWSRIGDHFQLQFSEVEFWAQPSDPLRGFEVLDEYGNWHPAIAEIDGASILVRSSEVPEPVAVRFAWSDDPGVNLFNQAGLPPFPFRTDDLPLTT